MARRGLPMKLPASGRNGDELTAIPWVEADQFLVTVGRDRPQTEKTYRTALRVFADWAQQHRRDGFSLQQGWPLDPASLTTETITRFHGWLRSNYPTRTVRTYMATVMAYLNYLDSVDLLPGGVNLGKLKNQLSRNRGRAPASDIRVLDEARQDIPLIADHFVNFPLPPENDRYNRRLTVLRNAAMAATLFCTAVRVSELVSLDRLQVDNGRARYVTIVGKGDKTRTVHLLAEARERIQLYLAEREDANSALFVSHSLVTKGQRLTARAVESIIQEAVKALGLDERLSPHDFRHFRATQLLREGMPLEAVQEYLGHESISTTRGIYAPLLGQELVRGYLEELTRSIDDYAAARRRERDSRDGANGERQAVESERGR